MSIPPPSIPIQGLQGRLRGVLGVIWIRGQEWSGRYEESSERRHTPMPNKCTDTPLRTDPVHGFHISRYEHAGRLERHQPIRLMAARFRLIGR